MDKNNIMDWKEQLNKKAIELQIKKEVSNGKNTARTVSTSRVNSRRSNYRIGSSIKPSSNSRGIGGGGSDLLHRNTSEKINNAQRKEEKLMITREAALDDLEKLEQETTDSAGKVVVKVAKVIIKMLATIRSNQLLTDADKISIRERKLQRKQADVSKS